VYPIEDGFDEGNPLAPPQSLELLRRPLPPYAMSLCAAPSYLRKRGTPRTPADLEGHDCQSHLAWRGGHGWQLANGEQVDWEARLTCNDGFALREAAVAGAGLVLQPTALLAGEIAAGRLKPLLRDYLPEPRPMHLIYLPDRRPRPRLQCFVDFVMTTLGQ
jgi:DNA-binding transcriptional LysR family regulator